MNKAQRRILNLVISLLTIVLFMILTIYAVQFVIVGIPEHSPSLNAPMAIAFGSMVLMGLFVSFYACIELLKEIKK